MLSLQLGALHSRCATVGPPKLVCRFRRLFSERRRAALAAAKARGAVLGGDRGYRPATGPDSGAAALARRLVAQQAAHRLHLEVDAARAGGATTHQGLARALTERGVPTPRGGAIWTHTTVARALGRARVGCVAE